MRPSPPARRCLALALVVALAAAVPAAAEKCGWRDNNRLCTDKTACCNKYGWCGVGAGYCKPDICVSGACTGKAPTPTPTPTPSPPPGKKVPVPAPKPSPSPSPKPTPKPSPKPTTSNTPATPEGLKPARAKVGATAAARCVPANQVITSIVAPVFGLASAGCNSTKAYKVVAAACLNKRECSVAASLAAFGGDPCPKVKNTKFLTFSYSCGLAKIDVAPASGTQYSKLWGAAGERWGPTSRLADWSYAGYMANEAGIPRYPVKVNVRDHGAKGDGVADDTQAFISAIAAASQLALPYSTVQCSKGGRRCVVQGSGFQNGGKAGVAVLAPAGTYKLTKMIEIQTSNVVLRGEGKDKTTLYFPKGLKELYGGAMDWAYMGGFLTLHGKHHDSGNTEFKLADIKQAATKGQRRLYVTDTSGFKKGNWVRLYARTPLRSRRRSLLAADPAAAEPQVEAQQAGGAAGVQAALVPGDGGTHYLPLPAAFIEGRKQVLELGLGQAELGERGVQSAVADGTLDAYLYGENAVSSGAKPYNGERIRFASRVAAVGAGWIDLERPLLYDLRLEWSPSLYSFSNPLQHSGFEDFTIQFKWAKYPAHMDVVGNNGIWIYGSANAWIKNVHFIDADTGSETINSDFVTVAGCSSAITAPRGTVDTQWSDGHHGLWAASSSNVRITDFNFGSRFLHDLTLDVFAQECVYHRGKGIDVALDMHRSAVHNNLLSYIDVGDGTRPFSSSGSEPRGSHAAANNTYWNIFSSDKTQLFLPDCQFGPLLNFIGGPYGPPATCMQSKCKSASADAEAGTYPSYCPEVGWFVEQRGAGKTLAPADLFAAQLDKRTG